jgi:hypothetical protein
MKTRMSMVMGSLKIRLLIRILRLKQMDRKVPWD